MKNLSINIKGERRKIIKDDLENDNTLIDFNILKSEKVKHKTKLITRNKLSNKMN